MIFIEHLHFGSKVHLFLLGRLLLTSTIAGDIRAFSYRLRSRVVLVTVRVRKLRRHRGSRTGCYAFGRWWSRGCIIIRRVFPCGIAEISIQRLSTPFIVIFSTHFEFSFDSVYRRRVVACSGRFELLGRTAGGAGRDDSFELKFVRIIIIKKNS